jgi:hypothetical protein
MPFNDHTVLFFVVSWFRGFVPIHVSETRHSNGEA